MKIKKAIAVLLSLALSTSFVACGTQTKNTAEVSGAKESTKQSTEVEKKANETKEVKFPTEAIQIIVPYSAGGGTDSVARAFAEAAKNHFSKPIIVVNKAGGGGAVGMSEGLRSKADGHTVTMVTVELTTLAHLGLAPFTYSDFKPIMRINADPAALTVKADARWNSVDEFIKYAKENPGKVKIGNSGMGAIWHLAAASIGEKTGAKFNHIPFEGAAPAVAALLGGHIDAITVSPAEVASQVSAGQLKVLGVVADERSAGMPDVKTFKEQGIDLSIGTWRGLAVPKDTPDEVVKILQDGFTKTANEQSFKAFMTKLNLGLAVQDSEKFTESIKKDNDTFKGLIEKLGLKK